MGNLIQWYGPSVGSGWDTTKVYYGTTETGAFAEIASVSPITVTKYWHEVGAQGDWYKIAFHNSITDVTGPLSDSFNPEFSSQLYVTPTELRKFMQFDSQDFPNDEDVTLFLEQAHTQLTDDIGGFNSIGSVPKLKLLSLLLGSSFICRALATKSLAYGYISVSLEGGTIVKAYDALMRLSEFYLDKYREQLAKDTIDYTMTSFVASRVDPSVAGEILDIQNGVRDALDFQRSYRPSMSSRFSPRGAR
jgi:hypothetical protein